MLKTIKRFYIDKPGGSYGTKPRKWCKIFKRKLRILETRHRIDGNGVKYTECLVDCNIPGHTTITVCLSDPKMRKARVTNTRVLKK
jgi:hypothetical protein